jgi:hypothetical protein
MAPRPAGGIDSTAALRVASSCRPTNKPRTGRGLVLLRHSSCRGKVWRLCPQQGHRGSAWAKVRARRMRSVAIEFGT